MLKYGTTYTNITVTFGGTLAERDAIVTTNLPKFQTTFIEYDATTVLNIYLLTKDGWRLM